ncbi:MULTISPECIES: hypothetical protein [unclassified Microbacterium]|uniref:hypothetical protein n=1 Tax=unclassified Microbacterium TaxID=2609290 RepID=UPI00342EE729
MTSVLWVRHHMRMVAGLPWWMRLYEIARLLRIRSRITRQHRVSDPACLWFAGHGVVRRVLGVRVPSIRRLRFDRARGRACAACTPKPERYPLPAPIARHVVQLEDEFTEWVSRAR